MAFTVDRIKFVLGTSNFRLYFESEKMCQSILKNLEVNLRIGHTSQALLGIEFENVGKSKTFSLCVMFFFFTINHYSLTKKPFKNCHTQLCRAFHIGHLSKLGLKYQRVSCDRFLGRTHTPRTSRFKCTHKRVCTFILWWSHFAPAPFVIYYIFICTNLVSQQTYNNFGPNFFYILQ